LLESMSRVPLSYHFGVSPNGSGRLPRVGHPSLLRDQLPWFPFSFRSGGSRGLTPLRFKVLLVLEKIFVSEHFPL